MSTTVPRDISPETMLHSCSESSIARRLIYRLSCEVLELCLAAGFTLFTKVLNGCPHVLFVPPFSDAKGSIFDFVL